MQYATEKKEQDSRNFFKKILRINKHAELVCQLYSLSKERDPSVLGTLEEQTRNVYYTGGSENGRATYLSYIKHNYPYYILRALFSPFRPRVGALEPTRVPFKRNRFMASIRHQTWPHKGFPSRRNNF